MVISITSLKGGSGKSTIAMNLAVCFAHAKYKVCIVDTDTNQSSYRWQGLRPNDLPKVPVFGALDGSSLTPTVKALNADYEIVIIDGTPSLSKTTSKIILLADIIIIPVMTSGLDVWATEMFLERFKDAKEQREEDITAYFLLNKYKSNINFAKEVKDVLYETGIPLLETTINDRIIYAIASVQGLGVLECKDLKAKNEMTKLFNEIIKLNKNKNKKS